jgi:hypothetical protein
MEDTMIYARLALGVRDRDLAEKKAQGLSDLGFKVIRVGSRGVSFEGSVDLFQDTFQCDVETSTGGAHFESTPTIPGDIKEDVDSVYFPTKPTFFR